MYHNVTYLVKPHFGDFCGGVVAAGGKGAGSKEVGEKNGKKRGTGAWLFTTSNAGGLAVGWVGRKKPQGSESGALRYRFVAADGRPWMGSIWRGLR